MGSALRGWRRAGGEGEAREPLARARFKEYINEAIAARSRCSSVSGTQIHPVVRSASELSRSRRVGVLVLGWREALFGGVVAVPVVPACVCGGGAAFAVARVQGA